MMKNTAESTLFGIAGETISFQEGISCKIYGMDCHAYGSQRRRQGSKVHFSGLVRVVSILVVAVVLLSAFSTSSAGAVSQEETINVTFGINIRVDGILFQPSDELGENVEPFLYNGTVYVPLRAISELFGADIQWLENPQYNRDMVYLDNSTAHELTYVGEMTYLKTRSERSITVEKNSTIMLKTGTNNYIEHTPTDVNGNPVPIILYNGTNYYPLRDISRVFNTDIDWNGTTYTVFLGDNRGINCDPVDYNCQARPIVEDIVITYEMTNNNMDYLYNDRRGTVCDLLRRAIGIHYLPNVNEESIEQIEVFFEEIRSLCGQIYDTNYEYGWSYVHGSISRVQNMDSFDQNRLATAYGVVVDIRGWFNITEEIKCNCTDEILDGYDLRISEIEDRLR